MVPEHLHYLRGFVLALLSQTHAPDEIVFVTSALSDKQREEFEAKISLLKSTNVTHYHASSRLSAGAARHLGVSFCNSHLVSMMDVDDIPHPMRNQILTEIFSSSRVEVLVHSFLLHPEAEDLNEQAQHWFSSTLPRSQNTAELLKFNGFALQFEKSQLADMALAHGHATFLRKAYGKLLRYWPRPIKGQDVQFLRDQLLVRRVHGVPVQLSLYRNSTLFHGRKSSLTAEDLYNPRQKPMELLQGLVRIVRKLFRISRHS